MDVWKFTPVAAADDPRWLGRPRLDLLLVEAETLAAALVVAADFELKKAPPQVGNESPSRGAALADEKLYRVDRAAPDDLAALNLDAKDHENVLFSR